MNFRTDVTVYFFLKDDRELDDFADIGRLFHARGPDTANGLEPSDALQ